MADAAVTGYPPGYPTKWGNKTVSFFDWTGPTLYATGGVALEASDLGVGGIDAIIGGASRTGTYFAMGRVTGEGANQSVMIMVFVSSSGAEAGAIDLDEEIFRLGAVLV